MGLTTPALRAPQTQRCKESATNVVSRQPTKESPRIKSETKGCRLASVASTHGLVAAPAKKCPHRCDCLRLHGFFMTSLDMVDATCLKKKGVLSNKIQANVQAPSSWLLVLHLFSTDLVLQTHPAKVTRQWPASSAVTSCWAVAGIPARSTSGAEWVQVYEQPPTYERWKSRLQGYSG